MATDDDVRSVTNTLSGTTADTVTLLQAWPAIEVTNHHATELIYFRQDGTTAVAAADGATVVLPASTKVVKSVVNRNESTGASTSVLSIVGNGNVYTIEGVA